MGLTCMEVLITWSGYKIAPLMKPLTAPSLNLDIVLLLKSLCSCSAIDNMLFSLLVCNVFSAMLYDVFITGLSKATPMISI